jgi:hypothetical protein
MTTMLPTCVSFIARHALVNRRQYVVLTQEDVHQHVQSQPGLLPCPAKPRPHLLTGILDEPQDLLGVLRDISHLVLLWHTEENNLRYSVCTQTYRLGTRLQI